MSQTLSRGLEALTALGTGPQSIGEIAERLGVHHSTALRLLHTLEGGGFVYRHEGRYRLGPRIAWLGQAMLEQVDLRSIARPYIERLAADVGETVHLAMLVGSVVTYIEKVESIHPVRMYSQVGKSAPLHCTGVAKAIAFANPQLRKVLESAPQPYERFTPHTRTRFEELARDFEDAAAHGYVLDDREHDLSIHSVATPIRSSDGLVTSAISISVPVHRCSHDQLLGYAPLLLDAARDISRELGFYGTDPTSSRR